MRLFLPCARARSARRRTPRRCRASRRRPRRSPARGCRRRRSAPGSARSRGSRRRPRRRPRRATVDSIPVRSPPMVQPRIAPQVRRHTSPVGVESRGPASARPSRSGMKLSPRSRADWSAIATPASTSPKTRASTAGHRLSSAYARVFSPQPNGESHVSHELSMRCRSSLGVPSALPMPQKQEGDDEHPHGERVRAARRAHELAGDESDAEEGDADARRRRSRRPSLRCVALPGAEERERGERGEDDVRDEPVDRRRDDGGRADRRASPRPARRDPAPRPCACGARRGRCS